MHLRFKGYGYLGIVILIGAFLVFRSLFENLLHESDGKLRMHVNGIVLVAAGLITFIVAARMDARNGIDLRSKRAWTSELFVSEHICLSLPLRLFGVLLIILSFFF